MIRKAANSDLDSVKILVEELEDQQFDFEKFKEIFFRNLLNEDVHYFVAEVNNEVIGFMSLFESTPLHHCDKLAEIQELIVKESCRGLNIGKEFIVVANDLAAKNSWLQIELSSNMKRLKAHSFYLRNEFSRGHFKFAKRMK